MRNFFNKYGWGAIILLLWLGYLLTLLKSCESKPISSIDLKPELKLQDSFRTIYKYKDSIQVKEVVKWKKTREKALNDTIPTYTEVVHIIHSCDTVLMADSSLIVSLKNLVGIQDIISVKKDSLITQKTDSIKLLSKKLKWSKLKTKGVLALWLIRESVEVGLRVKP